MVWVGWVRALGSLWGLFHPQGPPGDSASPGSHNQQQGRPQVMKHRLFVTASSPKTGGCTDHKHGPSPGEGGAQDPMQVLILTCMPLTILGASLQALSILHTAVYTGCILASGRRHARLPYRHARELVRMSGPWNHPGTDTLVQDR